MINFKLLEAALLLILLLNFLRANLVVNPFILIILALLYFGFFGLSFFDSASRRYSTGLRLFLFWAIVAIAFTFVVFARSKSDIHDGAVLTQAATDAFLSGQNPY